MRTGLAQKKRKGDERDDKRGTLFVIIGSGYFMLFVVCLLYFC